MVADDHLEFSISQLPRKIEHVQVGNHWPKLIAAWVTVTGMDRGGTSTCAALKTQVRLGALPTPMSPRRAEARRAARARNHRVKWLFEWQRRALGSVCCR